jgi:alpha-beta hydrolase superfamily lysophospholipase
VKLRAQVRAYQRRTKEMASRMLGQNSGSGNSSRKNSSSRSSTNDSNTTNSNGSENISDMTKDAANLDEYDEDSEPTAPRLASGAAGVLGKNHAVASSTTVTRGQGTNPSSTKSSINGSNGSSAWLGAVSLELDEPILFDQGAVTALVDQLKSSAAAAPADRERSTRALAHMLAPGGSNTTADGDSNQNSSSTTAAAPTSGGGSAAAASTWVFGDLNRPGAFVRPRPKRHPNNTSAPADCECCA